MKKIKILSIIAFALSLTGCLKDKPNVDFSNVAPTAEISSGSLVSDNSPISGVSYFKSATLPSFSKDTTCDCYLPDTVTFNVNITGEYPPTKDVTVTLGIDDTKRVAYNSLPIADVQYQAAPDSIYTLITKSVLVKAGSRLAKASIVFYPAKIDPSTSYLFPVSITDASGTLISGNLGTVYFHNLGNKNAGAYAETGTRTNFNGAAAAGSIAGVSDLAGVKNAAPENTTVIDIDYANLGPSHYIITFNADGTAITNLKVDDDFTASVSNFGIDSYTYDLTTRTIHVISHYTNGAGNDRVIEEFLTHQ